MSDRALKKAGDPGKELVSAIAMDIGKEVVAYIEVMYPEMFNAVTKSARLSVRNCIHNEIMAAIEFSDEGEIIGRMKKRKELRRQWVGAYRKMRKGNP